MLCGIAGLLLASHTEFVSPAYMTWQRSGDLIFMTVLGGLGSGIGAVVGAAVFLLLEEFLSDITEHWRMIFGPLLILVVIFGRGGIMGFVRPRRHA
jgi:branched-chain amino acid transport system permease protein